MPVSVLVVDDSDVIRSMILKTLRLADVAVSTAYEASNGREALVLLEDNWVDVVLADINMPVMDGIEMLRRIRASADHANLPVIIVSTEGAASRVAELTEAGVSAYVSKPFTPERIRDVVERVTRDMKSDLEEEAAEAVRWTFTDVMQKFVLMDAIPAGSQFPETDPRDGELLEAHMTFKGRECGSMTLVAPWALCREMAANVIGVEPDDPRAGDNAGDALGEVLNMTCGVLTTLREPGCPTELRPPTVVGVDLAAWERLMAFPTTFRFEIEGRPVLLHCSIRQSG
jgi:two-component system chemotaxis response regulator CheY